MKPTKIVGLLGYPVGHSVSPAMHNAAFQALKLPFEYIAFEVEPKDLAVSLQGLRALHIAGFNVTIPHKEQILSLLDELTPLAKTIGAVNTVVNQQGKLIGYNTDGPGFLEALRQEASYQPQGQKVLLLGAGGAARAVATTLAEAGAAQLTICDLQASKAEELAAYITAYFSCSCKSLQPTVENLQAALNQAQLLVNATPVGMAPKTTASPLPPSVKIPPHLLVYDLVYNPLETTLLRQAKAAGCRTFSGLSMLVRQGALAFTLWTGEEAPLSLMQQAAREALLRQS